MIHEFTVPKRGTIRLGMCNTYRPIWFAHLETAGKLRDEGGETEFIVTDKLLYIVLFFSSIGTFSSRNFDHVKAEPATIDEYLAFKQKHL